MTMKYIVFVLIGVAFGINMSHSGFLSWMAWQDMFLFRSWQLIGVILVANLTGITGIYLIKKYKLRDRNGVPIQFPAKAKSFHRYAWGGLIFGIGWTIAGCPGTTYTLLGQGSYNMLLVLGGALVGTLLYGLVKKYLPH